MGYIFPETPTIDDYLTQLEYSIKRITIKENNVIFDRCPIDLFAYIQATDKTDLQPLYVKNQNIIDEIDLFVFVPIEEPDPILNCQSLDYR
ncbi:MAG: hypothetical protein E6767_17690 [Dysgonomonas sp.]|nr:hypothetical protein [Dysgonomonas sp.]